MKKIMSLSEKLEAMKNKTWLYIGKPQRILNYKCDNGTVMIATDKDILEFETEKLSNEIDKLFVPANSEIEVISKIAAIESIRKETPSLIETVINTIKKVETDKEYIPQAHALYKGINTLINMMRFDLQVRKFANRED